MERCPRRLAQPQPELRELSCRHQSECVNAAAGAGWPGFSCVGCEGFEAMSAAEHHDDLEPLAELLTAIMSDVFIHPPKVRPLERPPA